MSKELKENMGIMYHQIENINKVIEIIKRKKPNQLEILELKCIIIGKKKKNPWGGSRTDLSRQKNESVNLKIDQLRLACLLERKKKTEKTVQNLKNYQLY